jgi:hypothetical protein
MPDTVLTPTKLSQMLTEIGLQKSDLETKLGEAQIIVDGIKGEILVKEAEENLVAILLKNRTDGESKTAPATTSYQPASSVDWGNLSRTYVVESAVRELTQFGGSTTPEAIEAFLDKRNRNDTRNDISGALSYLRLNNKVHRMERKQWAIGPEPVEVT